MLRAILCALPSIVTHNNRPARPAQDQWIESSSNQVAGARWQRWQPPMMVGMYLLMFLAILCAFPSMATHDNKLARPAQDQLIESSGNQVVGARCHSYPPLMMAGMYRLLFLAILCALPSIVTHYNRPSRPDQDQLIES